MYSRVLRSFFPAALVYVLAFSVLGFLAFQGFLLLDPSTIAEWLLMGVPAAVSAAAALKVLLSELWVQLLEASRAELSSVSRDRSWLPESDLDVLRLGVRYQRSTPAAQEVFQTLLGDALADRAAPDGLLLLSSAQILASEVSP